MWKTSNAFTSASTRVQVSATLQTIHSQLNGERETLILPNSMKRGHNKRSQSDTVFEKLAAASIGRLPTSEIDKIFNRFNVAATFGAEPEPRFYNLVL